MESDATRLHQVLLNLFVNARDAMPSGGSITVMAENVLLDEAAAAGHPGAAAGPHVRLRVADTGTGIPPDVMARIFDPFFTTKEAGKGTGLGLSTVLTILKEHNGFITVESVVNHGTTFAAHFPARMGAVADGGKPESASPVGAGQTVLVVDDEGAIRGMVKGILESHGYRVETAGDAGKALELFADHATAIHAVVTDLSMPGMAGEQLIQVLQDLNPRLPIIVSSGSAEPKSGLLEAMAVHQVLRKPYTARALLEALDSALRG
jgi:CheY-like chemotaxis protein